jgi:hypothetical protein
LIQTIIPKASDNNPEKYSHYPFITHRQKKDNKPIDFPFKICYPELDKEELS